MDFFKTYEEDLTERKNLGLPPLALDKEQTTQLIELLKKDHKESPKLLDLLLNRINPGVDDSAYIKAAFLNDIVLEKVSCPHISKLKAIEILGTMYGGFNIKPLVDALSNKDEDLASKSASKLKSILLVYDAFNDIARLSKTNKYAKEVIDSWANAQWFLNKEKLAEKITLSVFKVDGETNTDDLSPAADAFTRPDIPLHSKAMLKNSMPNRDEIIAKLKAKTDIVAYVGDVVGTGSSRKSAINSVQWMFGNDIPNVPNKRTGGIVLGGIIAPIFFNTAQDSGALPIEIDVKNMQMGDIIELYPYKGEAFKDGKLIAKFNLTPNTLFDEFRAGGRIPLIIGRGLTRKAREFLAMGEENIFAKPNQPKDTGKGYTLAQKMIAKACGLSGVRAGTYVEPETKTVGSQDTTGGMTRDEIKELAALGFNADFVLQSFCHTAAYPKPTDVKLHHTLPDFISTRGGVSLQPGDGIIHSWLNRMVLPDTVGTGADSHTRFPIGISFPGGSGLVAFAAVTGAMPLNVPESILVRFKGTMKEGITLRDLVNAIPYYAIKQGLLTVAKKGKINAFAGKILEIEGLPNLKVEQAFELSDASAERSAAACTVKLNKEPVGEYLKSNIVLLESMIKAGYKDSNTLQRRIDKMKEWLAKPVLLEADFDAEYSHIIEIDLKDITEPILACPNDPDDVASLSEILADDNRAKKIDEVFVGSCMTNIGHYRALGEIVKNEGQVPVRLWVVPPTKMDAKQLTDEGYYSIFGAAGARIEMPGCSLCMGNQARVADNTVVFSTSTRNFNNRMGKGAKVYLGSSELAGLCALLGRLPSKKEYFDLVPRKIKGKEEEIYKYLNFNLIENYELSS